MLNCARFVRCEQGRDGYGIAVMVSCIVEAHVLVCVLQCFVFFFFFLIKPPPPKSSPFPHPPPLPTGEGTPPGGPALGLPEEPTPPPGGRPKGRLPPRRGDPPPRPPAPRATPRRSSSGAGAPSCCA